MNAPTLSSRMDVSLLESVFPLYVKVDSTGEEIDLIFDRLVEANPELKFEQTAEGEIVMMLPTGGRSGWRSAEITLQVGVWANRAGGFVFDSSVLFRLPSGAKRGPDCAWIDAARWQSLTEEQQDAYPPIAPDFVIELRSKSDRLKPLNEKMLEYIENGVRLAWLIDPSTRRVHIYRADGETVVLDNPTTVSGEAVMPGFVLELQKIFAG